MRISTNTIYQTGISRISELQSEQSRLQQQISSGSRILSPSDDPVAAARALEVQQAISSNNQYASNRIIAQNQLSAAESTLANATELLISTQATLVSAGNPTYSDSQRGFLATELRGRLDQLIGLANSTDGAGHYLFSGFQSTTAPFAKSASGATYQGDDGVQLLQVATSRNMAINESGQAIFQRSGAVVFKAINELITLLETPVSDQAGADALAAGLATSGAELNGAVDNVLVARAGIGSKLKELDALEASGADRDLQFQKTLSELQDLDYAKALSELTKQQVILSAAQQSFVKTVGLSLFNLL